MFFISRSFLSVSAAAAAVAVAKENKRNYDDEPDVVVVENIAKAVHYGSSGLLNRALPALLI